MLRAAHGAEALGLLNRIGRDGCDLIVLDHDDASHERMGLPQEATRGRAAGRHPGACSCPRARILPRRAAICDAAGFVTKPVDIPDLLAKLERYAVRPPPRRLALAGRAMTGG